WGGGGARAGRGLAGGGSRRRRPRWRRTRGRRSRDRAAEHAERLAPGLARGAIQDQDPVEVVELVLDHARLVPLDVALDDVAVDVLRAQPDPLAALDRHVVALVDQER